MLHWRYRPKSLHKHPQSASKRLVTCAPHRQGPAPHNAGVARRLCRFPICLHPPPPQHTNIGMNFIVLGAGAIGCYVGGRLAAHGQPVCLVGRPHALEPIAQHGLKVTDLDGFDRTVPASSLQLAPTLADAAPVSASPSAAAGLLASVPPMVATLSGSLISPSKSPFSSTDH